MMQKATHRLVRRPKMTGRHVADYMAGSERARRTIVRDSKYRPIARLIQHERAKTAISAFLRDERTDCDILTQEAAKLRSQMTDTDFEREVLDNNADYIDAFVEAFPRIELPDAQRMAVEPDMRLTLSGVEVNPDIRFALQRTTRTNRVRTGFVALRYAKGRPLSKDSAYWQSSLLFGCRVRADDGNEAEPEAKLCVTIDALTGLAYPTDGKALSSFRNIEAAMLSIAERWNSVEPPEGAVVA